MTIPGTVYLLHFKEPLKHARHYIGWASAKNLDARIEHHRNGTGARLPGVVSALGIEFVVARIWEDEDRDFERKLKRQKNGPRLCPVCTPPQEKPQVESPERLTEAHRDQSGEPVIDIMEKLREALEKVNSRRGPRECPGCGGRPGPTMSGMCGGCNWRG